MGAIGITVRHFEELRPAFEVARRREKPIVIDVKITNERPYPAEAMILDTTRFSAQAVERRNCRKEQRRIHKAESRWGRRLSR